MTKLFTIAAFSCLLSTIYGQSVESGGGLNRNKYFTWKPDEGHSYTEYHPGNGFTFFLSFEDTILKDVFVKLVLALEDYQGTLTTTNGGLAGSSTTHAEVNKTIIGLAFYPFNFKFFKSGRLNFGSSYNYLLSQKMNGYNSWWYLGTSSSGSSTLDNNSEKYENISSFSAVGRIAYTISVSKSWYIVPQYILTYGLGKEFKNLEAKTKSFRQTFALGINRSLHK